MPGRREIRRGQITLQSTGLVTGGGLFTKLADELIECASPRFRLLAERDCNLSPVTQASGCRSQNPRTSETAAVAIVTASEASTFALDDGLLPLGSSMQTRHSQNASRKRKNMTRPVIPRQPVAAFEINPSRHD